MRRDAATLARGAGTGLNPRSSDLQGDNLRTQSRRSATQTRSFSECKRRRSMNQELQQRVQQLLDGLVQSGEEVGLQVAAYVDGTLVTDAWAGVADETTRR